MNQYVNETVKQALYGLKLFNSNIRVKELP